MENILSDYKRDKLNNLLLLNSEEIPITSTGTIEVESNENYNECLDHIFELVPNNMGAIKVLKDERLGKLKIDLEDTKIEKFECNEIRFKKLSDHYGISTSITYYE